MGDRGNIEVKANGHSVFLYTHWSGSDLPTIVQEALRSAAGRARWSDAQYLARILFCRLVPVDDWAGALGFGISATVHDGEDQLVTVDVDKQTVFVSMPGIEQHYTFNAFVDAGTKVYES